MFDLILRPHPERDGRFLHSGQLGVSAAGLKRALDVAAATGGLMLLAPLFAFVMLAMRLRDPGPLLYGHERVGRGGRRFRCLKFRTMVIDAEDVLARHLEADPEAEREWRQTRKLRDDPRVTPLGSVLRRTSLDELPQLINVLRGEMSLVGPRPVVEAELEMYGTACADYLSVRPGITGLWQVSGRNDTSYAERVRLDTEYVRSQSLLRDAVILVRTVGVVFFQKGSY